MAKKANPNAEQEIEYNSAKITLIPRVPEEQDKEIADMLLQPEVRAALLIQKFDEYLDVNALAAEMKSQTAIIQSGDMSRVEAMLGAQAHTLDALFSTLARRAHMNMSAGHLEASTRFLKLALKAQSQAVRTLEALGELKNPKHIAFVAQANISGGHQQVNNGQIPRTGENKKEQIKLSEGNDHELSTNARAQGHAGAVNQKVEAMEKINRSKNH